jgi:hypothetical protein
MVPVKSLHLPEGQTGNAWEPSKPMMIYSIPPTRSVSHYYPLLSLLHSLFDVALEAMIIEFERTDRSKRLNTTEAVQLNVLISYVAQELGEYELEGRGSVTVVCRRSSSLLPSSDVYVSRFIIRTPLRPALCLLYSYDLLLCGNLTARMLRCLERWRC